MGADSHSAKSHVASVLLAEDDEMSREMLSRRLERHGYEVFSVRNGREALEALAGRRFDVVLLDWMMPELSGIDTLSAIRKQHDAADLPVIMITARDRSADMVQAFERGASDYVTKPIDFAVASVRIQTQVALQRARRALRVSEERYALAARGANDGLWDYNMDDDSLYVSARWLETLGEPAEERTGPLSFWLGRVHPDDLPVVRSALDAHLSGAADHFECEHRMRSSDGGLVWVLVRGMAVRNAQGRPYRVAGSQTDITARRAAEDQLRRDATHDPLTGLYNRRQLLVELEQQLGLALRHGHPLSFCFCDIDYFKQINDAQGHQAGDRVLRSVGETLRRHLRVGDIAGRYGGDELCVIFPHTPASRAVLVAERMRRALSSLAFQGAEDRPFRVSATFGVADMSEGGQDAESLIAAADAALYKAKKLGRNCSYPPPG